MGLFLRANNLNSTREPKSHKKGLFQRSLEFSGSKKASDHEGAVRGPAIAEIIEETDEFEVDQELKINEIEIYEENDFSTTSYNLDSFKKNHSEKNLFEQHAKSYDVHQSDSNKLSAYAISEINDFTDELSHQLIRALERGKAFFLVKISLRKISGFISKTVTLNEQLEIIQSLMTDMGKAYLFGTYHVILVINKMYKPDPVIFMHQFRTAIKKNMVELENLNDLEFNPVVRVFPEHGKTIQKLIDGLFD